MWSSFPEVLNAPKGSPITATLPEPLAHTDPTLKTMYGMGLKLSLLSVE
jgi:hypothetical protein